MAVEETNEAPRENVQNLRARRTGWLAITLVLVVAALCAATLVGTFIFLNNNFAPLFLNSRIERLQERDLPKISVEGNRTIYCRMKADDFRFSLPLGTIATNLILSSGGFDTVHGSVEAVFMDPRRIEAGEYEKWIVTKIQTGGDISVLPLTNGYLIKFNYFGDR